MKKATFIIALSLITVFLTGHYFIYKSVLKEHKKEFRSYIRSRFEKAEQIEISPSELYSNNLRLTWHDENKEICLNGVMYDILKIKNAGTKVILYAVNDEHEKDLIDRYLDRFNTIYENWNTGKKSNNLLKNFLSLKFFQDKNLLITNPQIVQIHSFSNFIAEIASAFLSKESPPPDLRF